jgi:enamine deaminase RidA (YjgF/YER057c/UK114 family)
MMHPDRRQVEAGTVWGPTVGYSRAVRIGRTIHVAGTTGLTARGEVAEGGMYGQTRQALRNILAALATLGAGPEHVVRTRLFVTDISRWEEAGRAHGEIFAEIRPASTMLEITRLIDPAMLVEIEADAILPEDR